MLEQVLFGVSVVVSLLLSFLSKNVETVPIIEYDKGQRYEEYMVEHEISATQAKNAALSMDINSISSPPGCHQCTQKEIKYCLGPDLINDHCCCDKRYHENFAFVPHTCYLGPQICRPIVGDCAEYSRLRRCCCDKHVLNKWQKKSAGACNLAERHLVIILLLLNLALLCKFVH